MKLKCIIIDDEQLARKLLENYVNKFPELELVALCKNAMEAMTQLRNSNIDLIFCDIQMPDLSGVELVRTLCDQPLVVFTTAYSDYALEGFELDVIDYLLKPISFERFAVAVNKVLKQHELINNGIGQQQPIIVAEENTRDYITLKADGKLHKVQFKSILYIEGLREYVAFHTIDKKIVTLESLRKLENDLPDQFVRVHKSYIANVDYIKALNGNQIEIKDQLIPIGKTYKEVVSRLF